MLPPNVLECLLVDLKFLPLSISGEAHLTFTLVTESMLPVPNNLGFKFPKASSRFTTTGLIRSFPPRFYNCPGGIRMVFGPEAPVVISPSCFKSGFWKLPEILFECCFFNFF